MRGYIILLHTPKTHFCKSCALASKKRKHVQWRWHQWNIANSFFVVESEMAHLDMRFKIRKDILEYFLFWVCFCFFLNVIYPPYKRKTLSGIKYAWTKINKKDRDAFDLETGIKTFVILYMVGKSMHKDITIAYLVDIVLRPSKKKLVGWLVGWLFFTACQLL